MGGGGNLPPGTPLPLDRPDQLVVLEEEEMMGRNYGEEILEHPLNSLSFWRKAGRVSLWSSLAIVKPNGIRTLVVASLRLTRGRTLKEGLGRI